MHANTILFAGGAGILLFALASVAVVVVWPQNVGKQASGNSVGAEVGEHAPQFRVTTINGTTITSNNFLGKWW
jgi:cytochrome oxidase Cu insertion factor (SCO1/SenC/PrrC family)